MSQINATIPVTGTQIQAGPIQQNFAYAKSEIEALQAGAGVLDYSTTEADTGMKWSGKTIYQKTVIGPAFSGHDQHVAIGLPATGAGSIETILRWSLIVKQNGPPRKLFSMPAAEFMAWLAGNEIVVGSMTVNPFNHDGFHSTMWYTKL